MKTNQQIRAVWRIMPTWAKWADAGITAAIIAGAIWLAAR